MSNAMLINDLLFDESGIQKAYQQIILPYWNACSSYISYANIDEFKPELGVLKQPVLSASHLTGTNINERHLFHTASSVPLGPISLINGYWQSCMKQKSIFHFTWIIIR